jgi:hypothetical protein
MKRKLQVFVSSTFTDLIEERQAAVAAILKAGHIPAGMELFTAGDLSQMEVIKRWIDESDVYMLILGGRYGSVEPTTNLSYTELEYDYAREQGKPLFAVVVDDAALEDRVKRVGRSCIEQDNPKSLAEFRSKVLKNISAFFSDNKDIKLCVHEVLADLALKSDLKGWVSAAEIPDTKSLNNEIAALRKENVALNVELKKIKTESAKSKSSSKVSDDELAQVLRAIEIKVPENLNKGQEVTINLFDFSLRNLGILTTGVTNRSDAEDQAVFLYFNIFPRLQAHGLSDNERIPGVQYRRSFLNKTGREFFSGFERRLLLSKSAASGGATVASKGESSKKD